MWPAITKLVSAKFGSLLTTRIVAILIAREAIIVVITAAAMTIGVIIRNAIEATIAVAIVDCQHLYSS
jgi:hypothetical protein